MSDESSGTAIVPGTLCSGTSLTAGIRDITGVDMGNIRMSDTLNPGGYFEDVDFLKLGDEIFRSVDPEAQGFNPPAQAELLANGRKLFEDRVIHLLEDRRRTARGHWRWKATHVC